MPLPTITMLDSMSGGPASVDYRACRLLCVNEWAAIPSVDSADRADRARQSAVTLTRAGTEV